MIQDIEIISVAYLTDWFSMSKYKYKYTSMCVFLRLKERTVRGLNFVSKQIFISMTFWKFLPNFQLYFLGKTSMKAVKLK